MWLVDDSPPVKVEVESPTQKPGLATWRLANQKLTRVKVDVPNCHEMGLMSGRLDVCIVILNVLVVNF